MENYRDMALTCLGSDLLLTNWIADQAWILGGIKIQLLPAADCHCFIVITSCLSLLHFMSLLHVITSCLSLLHVTASCHQVKIQHLPAADCAARVSRTLK